MATTAHIIRSEYREEEDKARLEVETGQFGADADIEDPWLTANTFGVSKRVLNPPRFVPAVVIHDDWESIARPSDQTKQTSSETDLREDVSSWYRSLERKTPSGSGSGSRISSSPPLTGQITEPTVKKRLVKDKSNWFIARALENEASRSLTAIPPLTPPTSTLADILQRDPPPDPSEKPFVPPVWLAIGPGNRGFEMLSKSGWEEGEALGKNAPRRGIGYRHREPRPIAAEASTLTADTITKDVIDLTISDDEEEFVFSRTALEHSEKQENTEVTSDDIDHNPRALLTPLPTILKSDRLGIGLKAKTQGPYRESVKRVTHSQRALAAHVHANEALRATKKRVGRGRRGFEKGKRKEEQDRKNLLSYMNS